MEGFTACRVRQAPGGRLHAGFTLVEMIAVIVLLSFGLLAGTQLMTMTAQSYRDSSARMKLTQDARFAIERISRELRDALPGSVRESASGECIEWIPVVAAARYFNLPVVTPSNHFTVTALNATLAGGSSYYAVIFPVNENSVYNGAAPGPALHRLAGTPVNAGGETDTATDEIYLASSTQFTTQSPTARLYVTATPVAICARAGMLYRHDNYGFSADAGTLTDGVPLAGNVLLDDGGSVNVFGYSAATQTRNAMVRIDLRLRDNDETLKLEHTVFVRNAP